MKDYESYNNKGNKEIKDNVDLKAKEFYSRQFQDNILPGEYFDCRVNGLECELNDDNKYVYKEGEARTSQSSVNDMQDLSNAVNSSGSTSSATTASSTTAASNASIVEGAGTVVTGAATAVVGAAAAVVAFNAVTKETPKMSVNRLEAGSTYVYYDLNFENLDTDKEYDIVVKNPYHSFKIQCSNGNQDGYVYDLKPNLSYTLSLVGPHELFGTIEYDSQTFYTLPSAEVTTTPKMDIVYNNDLTCGVSFETVISDDSNKLGTTYIQVAQDKKIIFDSYNLKDYENDPNIVYEYDTDTKTHSGIIKKVDPGVVIYTTYIIDPKTNEKSIIETLTQEIKKPLSFDYGLNYVTISGDNTLIKEMIDAATPLYVRVNLFDEENVVTVVESLIDRNSDTFNYKTLVRYDTVTYNYQIGYYENSVFKVASQSELMNFTKQDYSATYTYVLPKNEELIDIKWKYNELNDVIENNLDYELMDITLQTNFDNGGNDDMLYRVELLRLDYDGETGEMINTLVDTYEGTGDATFSNVPVGEYNVEDGIYDMLYAYVFRYTSLMNYYFDGIETDVVEVDVREPEVEDDEVCMPIGINLEHSGGFELLSNGKLAFKVFSMADVDPVDREPISFGDDVIINIHYYEESSDVITQTFTAANIVAAESSEGYSILAFDLDRPSSETRGYYIEYEIPYHEKYGGNIRLLKSNGKELFGDLQQMAIPAYLYQAPKDEGIYAKIRVASYLRDGYIMNAYLNGSTDAYEPTLGDDGLYYYEGTFHEGDYLNFDVYNTISSYSLGTAYSYIVNANNSYEYMSKFGLHDFTEDRFGLDNIVYTYNNATVSDEGNEGTININLITGFENLNPDIYDIYLDYYLYKEDAELGDILVDSVEHCTSTVVNFNSSETNQYEYLDTFRLQYRVHLETKNPDYGMATLYYDSDLYLCYSFTFANSYIMTDAEHLKPQRYDADLYTLTLAAPVDCVYPHEQTVVFSVDGDTVDPVSLELSECVTGQTSDGTNYEFTVTQDIYETGVINFAINANYTLTDEKLEALGNNYEGDLYCKYIYQITGA